MQLRLSAGLDIAVVSILQCPHTAAPEHPVMGYATIVFSTGTNLMIAYRAYIKRLALAVHIAEDKPHTLLLLSAHARAAQDAVLNTSGDIILAMAA